MVVFCGPFTRTQKEIGMKKTFVDISKIKKALLWLKKHNKHYKDVKYTDMEIEPKYVHCSTEIDKKDTNVEQIFEMSAVIPDDSCELTGINGGYKSTHDFGKVVLSNMVSDKSNDNPTLIV